MSSILLPAPRGAGRTEVSFIAPRAKPVDLSHLATKQELGVLSSLLEQKDVHIAKLVEQVSEIALSSEAGAARHSEELLSLKAEVPAPVVVDESKFLETDTALTTLSARLTQIEINMKTQEHYVKNLISTIATSDTVVIEDKTASLRNMFILIGLNMLLVGYIWLTR